MSTKKLSIVTAALVAAVLCYPLTALAGEGSQKSVEVSAVTSENISQKLWSQFTAMIAASLGEGGSEASIQVLPQAVRLPQALDSKGDLNDALDLFFDTIPQWGSAYTASTRDVLGAYQDVLQQIEPASTSSDDLAKYNKKIELAREATDTASQYRQTKQRGWKNECDELTAAGFSPKDLPTFEEYFAPFRGVYQTMQDHATKLNQEAADLVKARSSSNVIQASIKVNDWLSKNTANPIPPWKYATDPWSTLNGWTKDKGLAPSTMSLDKASKTWDYKKSTWKENGSTSVFFGVWKKHNASGGSTESSIEESSKYTCRVSFRSTALLSALPSPTWYNGSVLVSNKNGPWVKNSNFYNRVSHPWDKGGVFPIQVTSVWVVFNPKIRMEFDERTFRTFKSTYDSSSGGGFNFGPFYRNPNSRSQSDMHTEVQFDEGKFIVTIEDTSNVPQIVAVANQLMPG